MLQAEPCKYIQMCMARFPMETGARLQTRLSTVPLTGDMHLFPLKITSCCLAEAVLSPLKA